MNSDQNSILTQKIHKNGMKDKPFIWQLRFNFLVISNTNKTSHAKFAIIF